MSSRQPGWCSGWQAPAASCPSSVDSGAAAFTCAYTPCCYMADGNNITVSHVISQQLHLHHQHQQQQLQPAQQHQQCFQHGQQQYTQSYQQPYQQQYTQQQYAHTQPQYSPVASPSPPQQQQHQQQHPEPHSYHTAASPPVYVLPVSAPVVAPSPHVYTSGANLAAAAATGYLTTSAGGLGATGWVHHASGNCGQAAPSYNPMAAAALSYHQPTGFWLQGFYFASYEHLMAYRRCAIAYNYHFFGIRPHFRPPAHLPRPRPPSGARRGAGATTQRGGAGMTGTTAPSSAAGVPDSPTQNTATATTSSASTSSATAAAEASPAALAAAAAASAGSPRSPAAPRSPSVGAVAGAPVPASGSGEDAESPCCSPGGSSSSCDSDDVGSDDAGRGEAADPDLLADMHGHDLPSAASPEGPSGRAPKAECVAMDPPGTCTADGASDSGLDLGLGLDADAGGGCETPTAMVTADCSPSALAGPGHAQPRSQFSMPGSMSASASASARPPTGPAPRPGGGASVGPGGSPAATPPPRPSRPNAPRSPRSPLSGRGSPRRRQSGTFARGCGGYGAEEHQQQHQQYGFDWVYGGAGVLAGSPVPAPCVCPQWLEPHLGGLLDCVVGEALWGAEGA